MSQRLNLGISGLNTNSNTQTLADGSLVNVSNFNIDRKIAESRRGFSKHSTVADLVTLTEYQDKLIGHSSANTLKYYNSGWNSYSGTIAAPSGNKMRFLQASQNLYFTTSTGVKMLDSYSASVASTGMPKGLDGSGSTTGASGWFTNSTQVAYRVVWGTRDANNNLYLGAPSQRIIVANSAGATRDVSLTFTIPSGITTSDFYQVYRSRMSADLSTEPDDEMQLVYEDNPTSGEITAKSITITDSTDDSLKGAFLYTNANQEGISESNDVPPWATDISEFKGFVFYSNIKTKHFIDIKLLAVSGSGLVVNDTITINSMVFTAKASTTVASREFKVFTSGSAAQNIDDTARELVKVINQYSSNTSVYAYYTTEYADLPGQIMIEERTLSDTAFTVSVSRAAAWDIPNSGTSENDEYQNGLAWSKIQQPEHVPSAHLEFIGSKSYAIKRILALKESLFILKEDGVFRLTGSGGSWSIDALDTSTILVATDTAVVVNNQIMCLSNQGVVAISDVGVQVIGEDIKDLIQNLIGVDYAALQTLSFGVAYETDRKYLLFLPTTENDTLATQAVVYNTFSNKWSRWEKDAAFGFVAPSNDKLYLAGASYLLEERKSFTYRDYIDEDFGSFSIVSFSGTSVVLNSVTDLTVGDLLYQSSSLFSPITAIDVATNTVTTDDSINWSIAAVTAYYGIDTLIEWAPQYFDNGGLEKFFQEVLVMFKQNRFKYASLDFYTDQNGGFEEVEVSGNYGGGDWGLFPWGTVPWGGASRPKPTRVSVPRNKKRGQLLGIRFSCRLAYSIVAIEGLSLQFDYVSQRIGTVNG